MFDICYYNENINLLDDKISSLMDKGYDTFVIVNNVINEQFDESIKLFSQKYNSMKIAIGQYIDYDYELLLKLKKHEIQGINNSNYIFLRLPLKDKPVQFNNLIDMCKNYNIIIDSIEDYNYFTIKDVISLKKDGYLITAKIKNYSKHKVKALIKLELIDFLIIGDEYSNKVIKNLKKIKKFKNQQYINKITNTNIGKVLK